MSISGVSSSTQDWQAQMQQRKEDISQLSAALQGGDLSSAQSAFTALQGLQPKQNSSATSSSNTTNSTGNTVSADFASLGQALQSGNLADAQTAFAKMQSDMQAQKGGHHHHHNAGTTPTNTSSTTDASTQEASALLATLSTPASTSTSTDTSSSTSTTKSPKAISADFSSLGQALQSGNLADAQSAFAKIQADMQARHQKDGGTYTQNATTTTTSDSLITVSA